MDIIRRSTHTNESMAKISLRPIELRPQDFCLTVLMFGFVKTLVSGVDFDHGESPSLLKFKQMNLEMENSIFSKKYMEGMCRFLTNGVQSQSRFPKFSLLQESITNIENESSQFDASESDFLNPDQEKGCSPLDYLNEVLTQRLEVEFIAYFYKVILYSVFKEPDSVGLDAFGNSILGLFLKEQAYRAESMGLKNLLEFIEQIKLYITDKPEHTKGTLVLDTVDYLDEAISRLSSLDPDLEATFYMIKDNQGGSFISQETRHVFARYLDQLASGDYEASSNSLNLFFEGCFVQESEFYPFALLNLGILNYRFQLDRAAVDFFIETMKIASWLEKHTCLDLALYWISKLRNRTTDPIVDEKARILLGSDWHLQLLEQLSEKMTPYAADCRKMLNLEKIFQGSLPYQSNFVPCEYHEKQDEQMLQLAERLMDMGQTEAVENLLRLIKKRTPDYAFSLGQPAWEALELNLQFEKEFACHRFHKAKVTLAKLEEILNKHRFLKPSVSIYRARILSAQNDPSNAIAVLYKALSDDNLLKYHRFLLYLALVDMYMAGGSFTEAIPLARTALELCSSDFHSGAWLTATLSLADAMASSTDDFVDQVEFLLQEIKTHVSTLNPWFNLIKGKTELALYSRSDSKEVQKLHLNSALDYFEIAVSGFSTQTYNPKLSVSIFLQESAKKLKTAKLD